MSDAHGTEQDEVVLALRRITKRFGAMVALDDVSFDVRRGTVHALLGENGAGKTTLMRIAFGVTPCDAGSVTIFGSATAARNAAGAIAAGVGMVHQHFTNVPAMTVAENVALGGHGRFNRSAAADQVRSIGARTGLDLEPAALADDLPVGGQQRLEIVKALARDARVLILDEPTAVLAPSEAADLLRWLKGFAAAGNSVVLITHKLAEALSIANDVTVLRHGRVVLRTPASNASVASLTHAMIGESAAPPEEIGPIRAGLGPVVVSAQRLYATDGRGVEVVRDASLEVREGEIVGIAGVEGAGQRELLRVLARRIEPVAGELQLPDAIGFVPEDRHRDALILEYDRAENLALKNAGRARGRIAWRALRDQATRLAEEFDVRGSSARSPVSALSGGNQQKLVLARELDGPPRLLVAENPTRGLDIRATVDVHDRLRSAASGGTAVVVYSSDLDEVLALATRVLVMHGGRLRETALDRDIVGAAMLGVA